MISLLPYTDESNCPCPKVRHTTLPRPPLPHRDGAHHAPRGHAGFSQTLTQHSQEYEQAFQATRDSQAALLAAADALHTALATAQLPTGSKELLASSAKLSKLRDRLHALNERAAKLEVHLHPVAA